MDTSITSARRLRKGIYVGIKGIYRLVFRSASTPTEATHGRAYAAVIGPFRTMRAARLMADVGANNPHLQTVIDAERIARRR